MPRKTQNLNSLSRGRVRASMNKYNLFNLYKKDKVSFDRLTLFQQKWKAKAETRAYHGEHLTESRWKTLFNPSLESVAQLDASLKGSRVQPTPMVLQTYAALEKRLELAVFRSMFASSVRQARQFILGGHVSVNGVVIKHPSFPLQAGDIFNVKPEKVLLAMGRVKPGLEQSVKVDNKQIIVWNKYVKSAKENPRDVWELKQAKPESLDTTRTENNAQSIKSFNDKLDKDMIRKQKETTRELILTRILTLASKQEEVDEKAFKEFGSQAKKCHDVYNLLFDSKHDMVENFSIEASTEFVNKKKPEMDAGEKHLTSSVKQILGEIQKVTVESIRVKAQESKLPEDAKTIPFTSQFAENLKTHKKLNKDEIMENEATAEISLPWQTGLFGRQDPTKPYFTPWTPRPFLGAFAILPSHIEVSFNTCHAIYLRDPIARPGHSEVITPFAEDVHERAYMYYVRKGL
ncbi:alpha-L RNA-binding motif-containing protein [Suhomyces tanzawaensis NRRL Y-17324]|uniref:Small ribosomal subunit protein uS4m n=1 Tax=Suhomyces tanzawaensis NRRL Y-17324 TaxID=984487 RepID=A0A1E4SKF1_9ASCO|nr:alpha-L RNA-binding motif-containing protein [Suhomyces tanzawaensis NRRL Y-17324]ODV79970.1 alpha-L RNA-binding motif-containing protein [Suhomyces tanzawaensis NRRL Y-17324]